jgi:hypothetical protein
MSQIQLRLWQSDSFKNLRSCSRYQQCIVVSQPNVFTSKNHHSARNETGVLASFEHSRQPMERDINIASAH